MSHSRVRWRSHRTALSPSTTDITLGKKKKKKKNGLSYPPIRYHARSERSSCTTSVTHGQAPPFDFLLQASLLTLSSTSTPSYGLEASPFLCRSGLSRKLSSTFTS